MIYIGLMVIEHLSVILIKETGVIYTNQVGGHSCSHPEIEGALIPINGRSVYYENKLYQYFTGHKHGGWCESGIDNEDADFIDKILHELRYENKSYTDDNCCNLKVDRSKLEESMEAWVYVTFTNGDESLCGVLTWENSD